MSSFRFIIEYHDILNSVTKNYYYCCYCCYY